MIKEEKKEEITMTKEEKNVIKLAQKEYFKKWRAQNKERIKKNNERYWLKRAMQILEEGKNNGGEQ